MVLTSTGEDENVVEDVFESLTGGDDGTRLADDVGVGKEVTAGEGVIGE